MVVFLIVLTYGTVELVLELLGANPVNQRRTRGFEKPHNDVPFGSSESSQALAAVGIDSSPWDTAQDIILLAKSAQCGIEILLLNR